MLTKYILKMPQTVYGGEDALSNLESILRDCGTKKAAVFTDKGIAAAGLLEPSLRRLQVSGTEIVILDDVQPEPTYGQVQALIERFRSTGADLIVAVGGGSVMDTAKLASILATDAYTVKDLLANPLLGKKTVKTVMIPTTAGTGSEATPNAIVAVTEQALKVGIVNDAMIADYVILDAEMIRKLPQKIAAATGVDALAHAIECWTSKKANPFSDMYALRALDLILNNILSACKNADDIEAKRQMQIASFFAGVAITASGTTAVHALSYPLGGKYHIAHGISNAILLTPVMRFNASACEDRLAEAYDHCVHSQRTCQTQHEKAEYMLAWLEQIVLDLNIPTSLQPFGVPAGDLDALVEAGMQVTRLLNNNLKAVTPQDARQIYASVL